MIWLDYKYHLIKILEFSLEIIGINDYQKHFPCQIFFLSLRWHFDHTECNKLTITVYNLKLILQYKTVRFKDGIIN